MGTLGRERPVAGDGSAPGWPRAAAAFVLGNPPGFGLESRHPLMRPRGLFPRLVAPCSGGLAVGEAGESEGLCQRRLPTVAAPAFPWEADLGAPAVRLEAAGALVPRGALSLDREGAGGARGGLERSGRTLDVRLACAGAAVLALGERRAPTSRTVTANSHTRTVDS